MKSLQYLLYFYCVFFLYSCGKPIGTSLLVSSTVDCNIEDCTNPDDLNNVTGALDIQPDSSLMSVNMETSDTVEITGTCKDLGRKKNRILVEVFAGEDDTAIPYIDNNISSDCQTINPAQIPQPGLDAASGKCFWVTKGTGLIEDQGLPSEKTFPQCHNGVFGFRVRLGKVLLNPGLANFKYLIRFKLRTQDGSISDSVFSTVSVDRGLTTPIINSATVVRQVPTDLNSAQLHRCNIKASPARFNFNIKYTLTRTYTDILSTNAGLQTRYAAIDTSAAPLVPPNVFDFDDTFNIIEGVTYNYTLTSTDTQFPYAPTSPTAASAVVSCTTDRPKINQFTPVAGTCFLHLDDTTISNPLGVYQWGYVIDNKTWIGLNGDTNSGFIDAAVTDPVGCGLNTTSCTVSGLAVGARHFFAVRARDTVNGVVGKWSSTVVECKP